MTDRRIEIRELEPGGPLELAGYASTFNTPYRVGSFTETILPGAFKRTLREEPDVSLLVNHAGLPLARTTSGTMTLTEDDRGLRVRAQLEPTDPDVMAIVPKLRRGDLSEMSFAFSTSDQGQEWSKDKRKRFLSEVTIHRGDVSLVGNAANQSATAGLRAEDLTLEQRERVAERIGRRVCGPYAALGIPEARRRRDRHGVGVDMAYVDLARAKANRARLSSRAGVPNLQVHDRPGHKEKYTDAEIQKAGEEGKAHKRLKGPGYHFPILDAEDVTHAINALGRANPDERASIRRFIIIRANELKVRHRIPDSWTTNPRPQKGDPNVNAPGKVSVPSAGGPLG